MITTRALGALCLVAACGIASCSTLQSDEGREPAVDPEQELRQSLAAFPGLGITLLPESLQKLAADRPGTTQLSSRDAELEDVMLTLFKDSGINLLIDSDVSGTATFDLKGVTPEAAFEALLRSYDLAYQWDGDFLRISTRATRSFDIDFPIPAGLNGMGMGAGNVAGAAGAGGANAAGAAATGAAAAGAGGANAGVANAGGANMGGAAQAGGFGGGVSIWARLEQDLSMLASTDRGARLIVNPRLGTVMVEGRPSTLARVSEYVATMRRRAMRQVSIEARILEVTLSDAFRTGVDFSLLPGFFRGSGGNRAGTLNGGAIVSSGNSASVGALQFGFSNAGQFSVFVDALEQQGQVRILSSPRVSTLNNRTAQIRVVQQVPVIERQIIDSESGSRTEFSVRFEEAGVSVDVTPQIAENGTITCRIAPRITEVSGFIETPDNLITEPILNTRALETMLRVRDGQPIVLGGLRGKRTSEDLDKIPILGDIPFLGVFFRKTSQTLEETELVIVMMPRILDAEWEREDLLRGVDRVMRLRKPYKMTPIDRLTEDAKRWWHQMLGGKPRTASTKSKELMLQPRSAPVSAAPTITKETLASLSLRRGLTALERGEQSEGLRRIDESLALNPSLAHGWLMRGVLAFRAGRLTRAANAFRECLRAAPKDGNAENNLGLVHLRSGNALAARNAFRRALQSGAIAEVHNNLGIALMTLGRRVEARKEFEKAVALAPNLAEAHVNLGVCCDLGGDKTRAKQAYAAYLDAGGDVGDARLLGLREHILGAHRPEPKLEAGAKAVAQPPK